MKKIPAISRRQFFTGGTASRNPTLPSLHTAAITPPSQFFRQQLRAIPAQLTDAWVLLVDGMAMKPLTFNFAEIMTFPTVEVPCTLACIGNRPGGDKIANAVWSGVRLNDLLAEVGVSSEARYAEITSADGYRTTLALRQLETALLAISINRMPLSPNEGAPARLIAPGLYGYKMPKWITRITLTDVPAAGFWEAQGWSLDGTVQTTAAIWLPQPRTRIAVGMPLLIAGMAYGGERRIVRVDVSIDDGAWMPAELQTRSNYEWALWHTIWTPTILGEFLIKVRAADATGYVQPDVLSDATFPNGAVGLHGVTVRVEASL